MQRGDDRERHGHGDRVAGDRADDRIEQPRQRRLADPPERQAENGDAELARGDVAVEVGNAILDVARAGPPLGHELLDARLSDGDERELGGDEEAVEEDQERDGE